VRDAGLKKISQKEVAYQKIADLLLKGELKPGSALSEEELAIRVNTSRTPVREALAQLSQEGLIEIIPRRGAFVSRITLADTRDFFQLREAIEGMAARLAAGKADLEALIKLEDDLEKAIKVKDDNKRHDLLRKHNDDLHEYIFEASGNPKLIQANNMYKTILRIEMEISNSYPGALEASYKDHKNIIIALKKQDPDLSEKAMRDHIRVVFSTVVSSIQNS